MPEPISPDALKPYLLQDEADRQWNALGIQAHPGAATLPRNNTFSSTGALTSGTLQCVGGVLLKPNVRYTSITAISGSQAAVAPTAQWFAAIRLSDRAVLAKTADDTNVAWPAFTKKTLAISGGFVVEDYTAVYLAILMAAGTPINLFGLIPSGASPTSDAPILCGSSTAALTTPGTLGATAAAITGNSLLGYLSIAAA